MSEVLSNFFSEWTNVELASFAATAIAALGSIVAALGVVVVWRQLRADHERSRVQGALNEMRVFIQICNDLKVMSPVVRMMDAFADAEYRCIHSHRAFTSSNEIQADAFLVASEWDLPEAEWPVIDGDNLKFSAEYSGKLRSVWTIYMNTLESIAAAWVSGVVDRTIIEREFKLILVFDGKRDLTRGWQAVAGGYPSLLLLTKELEAKEKRDEIRKNIA